MEKYTTELLAKMYSDLQQIALQTENHLQQAEQSFFIAESAIKKLKEYLAEYKFKDEKDEIRFFKEIKPLFLKELIYYNELFYTEANKPVGPQENQRLYYLKIHERLTGFFEKNKELYNYYRRGLTNLDEVYFLRTDKARSTLSVYNLYMDSTISTPYSFVLSELQAYEQLKGYLNNAIEGKEQSEFENAGESKKVKKVVWSASKAAACETCLSLYYSGAVNFGQGGLNEFVTRFEEFFNVKMGNIYRFEISMGMRKKELTPFLKSLIQTIVHRSDQKLL